MDLKGAVAVVTGGNGGLGQRICHALAKEGAHIAVIYAQSRDEAEAVARELTSRHQINAAAFACDVTDGAAVQGLIGDVTVRFGRLDVLVNDAAYNKSIPFTDLDNLTLEVWDKIMAVNLTGPMRLIKAVAPVMKAHGRGRIVNVASVAGRPVSRASSCPTCRKHSGVTLCQSFRAGDRRRRAHKHITEANLIRAIDRRMCSLDQDVGS
jgi:3-oxoacyl-[acyl-carrier protein] reductase